MPPVKKPVSKQVVDSLNRFEESFLTVLDEVAPEISEPSLTAIKAGGKRLRPALVIIAAGLGADIDEAGLRNACAAVELVHLASLVHDDVLDGADTRRGVSTINANYGHRRAILIGDYLFGTAFRLLAGCDDNRLIAPLAEASVLLSQGELQQRQALRRLDQTIEDYLTRIYTKTAALFVASCLMGARLAGVSEPVAEALRDYAEGLGIAFQIYDDILDFTGNEKALGKPVGSDIREGTVTLPMIYGLRLDGNGALAEAILDPRDEAVCNAVEHVIACGAIDQAKALATEYVDKAMAAANALPDGASKKDLLALGKFVIDRYH
ncbi:MAG: polyprenyl synthetase family protein [Actinomycetota bacterium]|nr:polyprenyl synthetase family protein [Actinomycetota bacterium]